MAEEEASFSTSIDSMSLGLMSFMARVIPSTMTIGALLWLIDEPPRMRNVGASPGSELVVETCIPATLPFRASPTEVTGAAATALPAIFDTAVVSVWRDCVPYPTTTTSSTSIDEAASVTSTTVCAGATATSAVR